MTLDQWSAAVTAAATVIYTIGTFLLWWMTRKSTRILKEQLQILEAQLNRQAALNKVMVTNATIDAHREVWLAIISNPLFLRLLHNDNPQGGERTAGEFLGSILINHCSRIHLNYASGIYDIADVDSFVRDTQHLFSFSLVRWRWESVRQYHKHGFVQFIETQIYRADGHSKEVCRNDVAADRL